MTQEYNNTLDTWYQNCHWAIQKVLETPYETISGWLRAVTGNPNTVAGQAPTYTSIAQQVQQIATDVRSTATGIQGWEGSAHNNFLMTLGKVEESAQKIAPAIEKTNEILRSAAETSVEAANMILDIVRGVIEFLVSSLAVSGALAAFTFGASFAGWIAANLAKGAHAVAKISSGLAKVAQVLQKIARALETIAKIMKKVTEFLKQLKELLNLLKELKKVSALRGKALIMGVQSLITMPIKSAANVGLDQVTNISGAEVNMPAGLGALKSGLQNGFDAINASDDAVAAAR